MAYGWEGKNIRLAPLSREKHLDNCVRWMNDPGITRQLQVGHFPMTLEVETAWFDRMLSHQTSDVVFAIETLEGKHIGQSGIHGINWIHRTAETGSFIADEGMRGKGYGTEAARLRSTYAFDVLGLRVLYAEFIDGNDASKKMQERAGYKIYARKPKAYYKDGGVLDSHLTMQTREMWEEAKAGWE